MIWILRRHGADVGGTSVMALNPDQIEASVSQIEPVRSPVCLAYP